MTVVMGTALVRRGRVLAARRTRPAASSGRWELPGGKVEDGEEPRACVVREIREELGCTVEVTGWLPGEEPIRPGLVLRVAVARLVAGDPTPAARDHDALRWLGPDELGRVDWLESDRAFLSPLSTVLRRDGSPDEARALPRHR